MKPKFLLVSCLVAGVSLAGWAQNVTITPLGAQAGEFCVGDRALLFQDPTGVRILTAPGRTVAGSSDPRLPSPTAANGGVHVVLIDHPHVDHIGDVRHLNCAGTSTTAFAFPADGNAPEVVAGQHSVLIVGGEMNSYFTQKIKDVSGTAPPSCPTTTNVIDNVVAVPRTSACVSSLRGGTITVKMNGQLDGVRITTIPAWHASGAPAALIDSPGEPPGMTGYAGTETGYIIRFTNGLTVLWTGDSGMIGDWGVQSDFYKPNLAVVHADGLLTMGPAEAAYAVDHLIHPKTVIPEHLNQVSTSGGAVVSGTRLDFFIGAVQTANVVVPLSGVAVQCDGKGRCNGNGNGNSGGDRGKQ